MAFPHTEHERDEPMKTTDRKTTTIDASALQIIRAYRAYYHCDVPDGMSYPDAAMQIAGAIGIERAAPFFKAQSNEVDGVPTCLYTVEHPDF
jgi:hypothetical protein